MSTTGSDDHRVGVLGSGGRMGTLVCEAIDRAPDLRLVARLGRGDDTRLLLDAGVHSLVDFTTPASVMGTLEMCIREGVHAVVGTSGFDPGRLDVISKWIEASTHRVGVLIAPNFSIGAVLLMQFAALAAACYQSVEVIDLHHAGKTDAPSGTALHTAGLIAQARTAAELDEMPDATDQELDGARGAVVEGIRVHSVRMQGLVGHQEVLLGSPGELLSIRHDSLDRASFIPGVLLGLRSIRQRAGLTVGLEHLLPVHQWSESRAQPTRTE